MLQRITKQETSTRSVQHVITVSSFAEKSHHLQERDTILNHTRDKKTTRLFSSLWDREVVLRLHFLKSHVCLSSFLSSFLCFLSTLVITAQKYISNKKQQEEAIKDCEIQNHCLYKKRRELAKRNGEEHKGIKMRTNREKEVIIITTLECSEKDNRKSWAKNASLINLLKSFIVNLFSFWSCSHSFSPFDIWEAFAVNSQSTKQTLNLASSSSPFLHSVSRILPFLSLKSCQKRVRFLQ